MSIHQIFDAIWNFPIPWLWIFGILGAIWLVLALFGLMVFTGIKKEERNARKP